MVDIRGNWELWGLLLQILMFIAVDLDGDEVF